MTGPGDLAGAVVGRIADELDLLLAEADAELQDSDPAAGRQPVHTAYIPAHRFDRDSVTTWGTQALDALAQHAPREDQFAEAMGLSPQLAAEVQPLVLAKLASEPIEDLRIDFEDGYGSRADDTEDAHARAAARALAGIMGDGDGDGDGAGPPPFAGLRCKSLERRTRRRAIRTLDAFLGALTEAGRPCPPGFLITLPKVTSVAQVEAMAVLCDGLELAHGLRPLRALALEIQVETPQAVLGRDGTATLARCVRAAAGRLSGLHYGTYDYSASLGIAAAYQSLDHPAADHAKAVMQVAAAGTRVRVCDGSTNVLPVGTRAEVTGAWQLHSRLVRRSLERGYYQGWDLHPAQLASRYAATYAFYREGLPAAAARLASHAERSAQGQEEPATIKALATYVLRALHCGAAGETDLTRQTGLGKPQLATASRTGRLPEQC